MAVLLPTMLVSFRSKYEVVSFAHVTADSAKQIGWINEEKTKRRASLTERRHKEERFRL